MVVKWRSLLIVDGALKEYAGETARVWTKDNLPDLMKGTEKAKKDQLTLNDNGTLVGHARAWRLLKEKVEQAGSRVYHPEHHPRPTKNEILPLPAAARVNEASVASPRAPSQVRRQEPTVLAQPKPLYKLTLELGDLDTLFDPIATGGSLWKEPGVLQRLQVLGYLYTPLGHPHVSSALAGAPFNKEGPAQLCWEYFKRVHKTDNDNVALQKLKDEIQGNLITAKHPVSGEVLDPSVLPLPTKFAAIRLPGGYGTTCSPVTGLRAGDHYFNKSAASQVPAKYVSKIGYRRNDIEDAVWADNPLLGKFPLIAKVVAEWPDGRVTPVRDAPVYFQLTPPDSHAGTAFAPPPLPDKVMNYALDGVYWGRNIFPVENQNSGGLTPLEWEGVWRLTHKAWDEEQDRDKAKAKANGWIDEWAKPPAVPWDAIKEWWGRQDDQPYGRLGKPPDEQIIPNIQTVLTKMDTLHPAVPDAPPVGAFALKMAKLTIDEFKWVWRLIKAAREKAGAARKTPKDLATEWVRAWADVPKGDYARIREWWTDANETPYPWIRPGLITNNAKARVNFLLQQREDALNRTAENTGAGQKKYVDDLISDFEKKAPNADPQKSNVPHTRGGKQGKTIDAIFEKPAGAQRGFHIGTKYGDLALAALPADTTKHHDAMECKTNADGYAGVIFMPSRCGGDSYRLHAYIDEDWLNKQSNGPAHQASAGTGTLVVWRNLRLYRYLQMRNPRTPYSQGLQEILDNGKNTPASDEYKLMGLDTDVLDMAVLPGVATEADEYAAGDPGELLKINEKSDHMKYRPLRVRANGFETQLQWGYCELLADCAAIEVMTAEERKNATVFARRALQNWWAGQGYNAIDWDTLFGFPMNAPAVDDSSPFLLNLRTFTHYNSLISQQFTALSTDTDTDKDHFTKGMQLFFEAMMEYFAGGGVLPGMTVVQIPRGDNWDIRAGYVTGSSTITSGYGTGSRGFYISHTKAVYHGIFRLYPCTANAMHELGHVLAFAHQKPAGADLEKSHQKAVTEPFQKPDVDQCVCVMSYSGCYGDLCGACILSLRGWTQEQSDHDIGALYSAK